MKVFLSLVATGLSVTWLMLPNVGDVAQPGDASPGKNLGAPVLSGVVPIGTIVAYSGDPAKLADSGWVICNKKNSEAYPGVPNLEDRFLQGQGTEPLGAAGGNNKIPGVSAGPPKGDVSTSKDPKQGDGAKGFQGEGAECYIVHASFNGEGLPAHDHGGENRPLYHTVHFIIRVN